MCVHIFGGKRAPRDPGGNSPSTTLPQPRAFRSPLRCSPRLCSALSPDMSFSAVRNDSGNRLGDADEQTVKEGDNTVTALTSHSL